MALPQAVTSILGTTLGKTALGLTVAATSLGGVAAAGVVDLPTLAQVPAEVSEETPDLPDAAQRGQDAAEAGADNGAVADEQKAAAQQNRDDAQENRQDGQDGQPEEGADPEDNDFGQAISALAQEGSTGQDLAGYARANNPGVEARQDADHRQDGTAHATGGTEDEADERSTETPEQAEAAGENRAPQADAAGENRAARP